MSNKLTYFLLILIVVSSIALRFFKLDKYPPSVTWDEAAVGYNAYTIINWGKDEWGKTLPLTFKSFGDDKNPVHIYLTAPFVAAFGLNDFAVRASAATFGVLNIIMVFFVARLLFKSNGMGLITSFLLATSPYNIQFSRFNHELNFAIFFFLAGVYLFYKSVENKGKYIIFAFLLFGLDLLTYQSAKVVTPVLVTLLVLLNIKKLLINKKSFFVGAAVYLFFISLLFVKPELLGGERLKQNKMSKETIEKTSLYQKTGNEILGMSEVIFYRYTMYFKNPYLFVNGDLNPRHSIQTTGTFYWLELPLLIIGFIGLLWKFVVKKDKQILFLFAWIFLAPIPGAVSSDLPHSARAMFITASWTMVSAYGAYTLINLFRNKYYQVLMSTVFVLSLSFFFQKYIKSYYLEYTQKYAIEWVYGMKEIVLETEKQDLYRVYMTNLRMQPYIFFLYYLKTPLPEYLDTVKYDKTKGSPSNLVASFDKYRFLWDEINSEPSEGVVYVVTPSIYDGLYSKNQFEILNIVKYPSGDNAFYMVDGHNQ